MINSSSSQDIVEDQEVIYVSEKGRNWYIYYRNHIEEYNCVICGKENSSILDVHHLKTYDGKKNDYDSNMLMILCRNCHGAVTAFNRIFGVNSAERITQNIEITSERWLSLLTGNNLNDLKKELIHFSGRVDDIQLAIETALVVKEVGGDEKYRSMMKEMGEDDFVIHPSPRQVLIDYKKRKEEQNNQPSGVA